MNRDDGKRRIKLENLLLGEIIEYRVKNDLKDAIKQHSAIKDVKIKKRKSQSK